MNLPPLSSCEKKFVVDAISRNHRIDGRANNVFRKVRINFGIDWGNVMVRLGQTQVIAEVTCELGTPKVTRPTEGILFINVDIGPMAAPHFQAGRNSEKLVQINRTLERTIRESHVVDLESLCVSAEEHVWVLRVDINVLNYEGNLIDACAIAALAGLAHFKRPDVSVVEHELHIHAATEKEPVPLVLNHYPVCISYGIFCDGEIVVADPNALEERVQESALVFGVNSFRELCCINLGGLTSAGLILKTLQQAARRSKYLVEFIKKALEEDQLQREAGKNVGFSECVRQHNFNALKDENYPLKLDAYGAKDLDVNRKIELAELNVEEFKRERIVSINEGSALLNSNNANIKWLADDSDHYESSDTNLEFNASNATEESVQSKSVESSPRRTSKTQLPAEAENNYQSTESSDSEEEIKMVL